MELLNADGAAREMGCCETVTGARQMKWRMKWRMNEAAMTGEANGNPHRGQEQ